MPYLTLTENLKLQLSPGLVASYDIQPGNGVGLFWDKHTHTYTYLLTYKILTKINELWNYFKSMMWRILSDKSQIHEIRSLVYKPM